jgi:hypothetical protein
MTTPLGRRSPSSLLHQDPAHGFADGGEEVAAAVPVLGFILPDKPE